jgi:putative exosortase-associated protein (TIGR04073 family)
MRNIIPFLALAVVVGFFITGCAGPEEKLGRGITNSFEIVRGGEMRRSIEQTSIFDSPSVGYTTGAIHGFDRTVERTGVGLWEVVTFPIPNHKDYDTYGPIDTAHLKPHTIYPDSYTPGLPSSGLLDTDTHTGFSGGDVAPWIPGNRFTVFDN